MNAPERRTAAPPPPPVERRRRSQRAVWHAGRWLSSPTFVRMFREDPFLRAATVAMVVATLIPVVVTPMLPLVDLGQGIGAAGLLDDVLRGREIIAAHYRINWQPVPYWSGYLLMAVLDIVAGPFVAASLSVALVVVLLPIAVMRLLVALGRSPRLGLWAFLFAWDVNIYWGWVTFQLGMALALFTLAWIAETTSSRQAARLIPGVAVVALTHVHATVLLTTAGLAMALAHPRPSRALLRYAVAMVGCVVLLPWLLSQAGAGDPRIAYRFEMHSLVERVQRLHFFTLDTLPGPFGSLLTILALFLLGLGPMLLMVRRTRPAPSRGMAVAFALTCVALYLLLPFAVFGPVRHWWTYARYGTYVFAGLLLVGAPEHTGPRAWVLAPGLALAVLLCVERTKQFAEFGRLTRPYLEIVRAMKPNSSFLALDFARDWPGTREEPLGQLHGFAAAARSSYDPRLFDNASTPLLFRDNRLPAPDWRRPADTFSMEAHGRFYDYIITYPRGLDIVAKLTSDDVHLLTESGEWRLYAVSQRATPLLP